MELIEIVRLVRVGMKRDGLRPSKRKGSKAMVHNLVDVFNVQVYSPHQNKRGVWRWIVCRTIAKNIVLNDDNAKYVGIPVGSLQNVPLSRYARLVCGIDKPPDDPEWRPTETVPEDYYALG
jgi:hypothetical protein